MDNNSMIEYHPEAVKWLLNFIRDFPSPTIYYTLAGSHLYGYASKDSDLDIRGCHTTPATTVCRLSWQPFMEVVEIPLNKHPESDSKIDFVTYDLKKELGLVLKNNSNIMEQIFAPPIITSQEHEELMQIADAALSKRIYGQYHGMAKRNFQRYIVEEKKKDAKIYLIVIRNLLAGIHALEKGSIESDLYELYDLYTNEDTQWDINELINAKIKGEDIESCILYNPLEDTISRLFDELDVAYENSSLPDDPPEYIYDLASDFLVECRMKPVKEAIIKPIRQAIMDAMSNTI